MNKKFIELFVTPIYIFFSIILYLVMVFVFKEVNVSFFILISGIFIGGFEFFAVIVSKIKSKRFSLDYIAILAILAALFTHNYLVCSVVILMVSGGYTLEKYASARAKDSLTALTQRIPHEVYLYTLGKMGKKVRINDVRKGMHILIRKGEVVPLDGILESESTRMDESSLTGEPFLLDKIKGDQIRSGTINIGSPMVIHVTKENPESTYTKIIEMVRQAQEEKPQLVRLAAKYNISFTVLTLLISLLSYTLTNDFSNVLAVLVIATPCPLILATPIALIGGMNSAAKRKIIIKRLSSLEVLSRVNSLIFDKTGTLTLGKPELTSVSLKSKNYSARNVLSIASAIERNSLHPIAKSIVIFAQKRKLPKLGVSHVEEFVGSHIQGVVNGKMYYLTKPKRQENTSIDLYEKKNNTKVLIAQLFFQDKLKANSADIIEEITHFKIDMKILTGDKKAATEAIVALLPRNIEWKAECSPQDKLNEIERLRKNHKTIAMVGDGINDAPALAKADVGLVFSNEERTAASEAADVVFLAGDLSSVSDSIMISRKTINIAKQSIIVGIGLSTIGMVFAGFGYIVPLAGALIQELIDVTVIFNSLRASKI